jgi:uncharacterized membrane protein YqaE (UPF0057 family)
MSARNTVHLTTLERAAGTLERLLDVGERLSRLRTDAADGRRCRLSDSGYGGKTPATAGLPRNDVAADTQAAASSVPALELGLAFARSLAGRVVSGPATKSPPESAMAMDRIRRLPAILPLGMFLQVGLGGRFRANVLLTLLRCIPGIVHAIRTFARR